MAYYDPDKDKKEVTLVKYGEHGFEKTGEVVSVYTLSRSFTQDNLARFLDDYLNGQGDGFRTGEEVASKLLTTHPTLQASLIRFALGILTGMAKAKWTDGRNETSVATARRIAEMLESGEIHRGMYV